MADELILAARAGGGVVATPVGRRRRWTLDRRERFLRHLSQTANVTRSAAAAGMHAPSAYLLRRRDPAFRTDWQAALTEAYHTLELQLLDRALNGIATPVAPGEAGPPAPRQDTGMMMKLLAMHRASAKGGGRTPPSPEALAERAAAARRKMAADLTLIAERLGVVHPDVVEEPDAAADAPADAPVGGAADPGADGGGGATTSAGDAPSVGAAVPGVTGPDGSGGPR